jgi:hypothetical protein
LADIWKAKFLLYHWLKMRIGVVLLLVAAAVACRGGGAALFRQYEYEEEIYLALDGTATIYVNGSVQAFNALRGTAFDPNPRGRFDDAAVRAYFTSPVTRVTRVSRPSRRNNRRYIHVRVDVADVRRLAEAAPFSWSTYRFEQDGELMVYQQRVGPPQRNSGDAPPAAAGSAAATGAADAAPGEDALDSSAAGGGRHPDEEIVAFRMHIPSEIAYHNTGEAPRRGNILVWEQTMSERLQGTPLIIDARMETESILFRTLILFGATIAAVAVTFGVIIWWVVRRPGRTHAA